MRGRRFAHFLIASMFGLLIAVIYLSFISLGLPDSLLGAAWPVMSVQFSAPLGYASIISIIIGVGTIISSLMSDRVTKRFGAGVVTAVSVAVTAAALFFFSVSTRFWMLVLAAIPYGLGAGGVDAALNNYVALHLKSRHMSWLHCMWGVGAAVSPYIMSYAISGGSWSRGYMIVAAVQAAIAVLVFLSLPVWNKGRGRVAASLPDAGDKCTEGDGAEEKCAATVQKTARGSSFKEVLATKGAVACLLCFFCYCALEQTAMLWASSYMIAHNGFSEERAAMFASLFFIGITAGRGINGFLTFKFSDRTLIRCGYMLILAGVALVALPFGAAAIAGFTVLGLGCAPVYPCIIHSTPTIFGADRSQQMIGFQMAFAYIGGLASPLFGVLVDAVTPSVLPAYLAAFLALMIAMHEVMVKRTAPRRL